MPPAAPMWRTCCWRVGWRGSVKSASRLSVGAGRARLVRQLLTEALVISVLAGVTGLVLARITLDGGLRVFYATATPEFAKIVRLHSLDPDYRVFLFALCAAMVAAVGAALAACPPGHSARPGLGAARRIWRGDSAPPAFATHWWCCRWWCALCCWFAGRCSIAGLPSFRHRTRACASKASSTCRRRVAALSLPRSFVRCPKWKRWLWPSARRGLAV